MTISHARCAWIRRVVGQEWVHLQLEEQGQGYSTLAMMMLKCLTGMMMTWLRCKQSLWYDESGLTTSSQSGQQSVMNSPKCITLELVGTAHSGTRHEVSLLADCLDDSATVPVSLCSNLHRNHPCCPQTCQPQTALQTCIISGT